MKKIILQKAIWDNLRQPMGIHLPISLRVRLQISKFDIYSNVFNYLSRSHPDIKEHAVHTFNQTKPTPAT